MRRIILAGFMVLAGAGASAQNFLPTPDPRVKIIAPRNGQVYSPGATVMVTVAVDRAIQPSSFDITVPVAGVFAGSDFNGSVYSSSFVVPAGIGTSLILYPDVIDANNMTISGAPVTLTIRPQGTLSGITVSPSALTLGALHQSAALTVMGQFPDGTQVDYSQGITGTIYQSNNGGVASVDGNGVVTATGYGSAIVTIHNGAAESRVLVTVTNNANPDIEDVSNKVIMTPGAPAIDPSGYYFNQTILITNTMPYPLLGPLNLVASGLPASVKLNDSGVTARMKPTGSPYVLLPLGDANSLAAGGKINLALQFTTLKKADIHYTPLLYRSAVP